MIARHLRTNAVGYVAVFLALTGGAYALQGRNTVDSGDIKKGQVKGPDLARNSVNSAKIARDSLTGEDIAESTLGAVPSATSADKLDDLDSTGFFQVDSGTTITGVWQVGGSSGPPSSAETVTGFPVQVSTPLVGALVNFGSDGINSATDADLSCNGSATNPIAPAGKVCLYWSFNTGNLTLEGEQGPADTFVNLRVLAARSSGSAAYMAEGVWAYTVP